jgi:type II secretory pathway component GspD/PulD (secretin)
MQPVAILCLIIALLGMLDPTAAQANDRVDRLISIDARESELRDIIGLIASQSNQHLVADASIGHERVSFALKNVSPQDALFALSRAFDLQTQRLGNFILVGSASAMERISLDDSSPTGSRTEIVRLKHTHPEEAVVLLRSALPAGTLIVGDKRSESILVTASAATLERAHHLIDAIDVPAPAPTMRSESISLRYVQAGEALKTLHGAFADATVFGDDRTNSVLVKGSDETLAAAKRLLAALDRPARQVLFEVRVADVMPNDDASTVGVQFGGPGFGTGALGQVPYTVINKAVQINAQLNALVQSGHAEIVATPRIATLNNREASLLVGEQYPVVTVNQQTGFPSVQTVDVGVRLRLTPTIGDDGSISAEVHPEFSQIVGYNASFPIIANRKVDTTLRVHDGETIVLGGLFQDVSSETISHVPLLANMPILGSFFRSKSRTHNHDEVVFFITPHVLAD